MCDGKVPGLSSWARTPPSAPPTARCSAARSPSRSGSWYAISSRPRPPSFWHDSPGVRDGALQTGEIGTEVFLLPAASHVEKEGSFTNTQRLLQWHRKAIEPEGDCRSDLWFYFHLGRLDPREAGCAAARRRARPTGARARLGVPRQRRARRAVRRGRAARDQRFGRRRRARGVHGARGRRLDDVRLLDLLRLLRRRHEPGRQAQEPTRTDVGRPRVGLGLAGEQAHPLQPGLGRP